MSEDRIRYDLRAQAALRDVIRQVLAEVATAGLPGDHHFYITFDTNADGVSLSKRLKARHPEEMTIVLQHQYWDLDVGPERFEVALSFGNQPERLVVPFAAIKGFFDPSVQFGLQFEHGPGAGGQADEDHASILDTVAPSSKKADETQDDEAPAETAETAETDADEITEPAKAQGAAASGGEVVNLDAFRKKR